MSSHILNWTAVIVFNLSGLADSLLILAAPISGTIKRIVKYDFDDTALALVQILNRQAREAGIALDWERY